MPPITINRYINVMKKLEKAILEKSTACCPRAPNAVDPLGQNKNPPLSGVSSDRDFCIFVSRPGRRLKQ